MPNSSLSALAIGARQFVVHDALEMIVCSAGVVLVVVDAHDDGDVLVLRRGGDDDLLGAGVDVRLGLGASVKKPVDSIDDVRAEVAQWSLPPGRAPRTP